MAETRSKPSKGSKRASTRTGAPKATIKDIARAAGVSVATVSRVLNTPDLVVAKKRQAVLRALRRHDYIPNQTARSMISRRSRAIGLILPTLANPVFVPAIAAIEQELDRAGYALLINCCERDPARELAQARTLIERGMDGLLITGSEHLPDLPALLARHRIPHVSQDVSQDIALDKPMGPSIGLDNAGALAAAVDHLHACGHRRIAVLSGPVHNTPSVRDRFLSAIARIRHHGLICPDAWCAVSDDYDNHSTRIAAQRLLDCGEQPTAVALTGDLLALGLISECRARSLDIPRDLSIIGCGDTNMGQYADPPLTTIHMPFVEMGRAAARDLLSLIEDRKPPELSILPHELVIRQSVAAPANAHSAKTGRLRTNRL
ncbi:LacI family DNA-binding transcriptional regulator [Roseiarcaceae bacterium H3SJ34-1]|uniref:LacI family DNA-binding transcriptional regulator n=1 Tax=Terripilifer ovatus TaxID=3032367 RepID=UPI003AB96726|nr:LacI family DNA-binding transcriptional regulator [Roseiarcaceae bacterium H3SJ34-1]